MKNTLFLHPIVLASSLNQVDPDIEIHSNPPFYKPNKQNINYIRMLMGKIPITLLNPGIPLNSYHVPTKIFREYD